MFRQYGKAIQIEYISPEHILEARLLLQSLAIEVSFFALS